MMQRTSHRSRWPLPRLRASRERATLDRSGCHLSGAQPERVRDVVVARSLCRVRPVALRDLAPNERDAALRMQALAWRPFPDAEVVVGRLGTRGIALAWDRSAALAAIRAAGCDEARVRLIPEPLLQRQCEDGVHLRRGLDGIEAALWSEGMPVASRWWPDAPGPAEWLEFLRLAGPAAAGLARPAPSHETEMTLRARPWLRCTPVDEAAQGLWPAERVAVAAAVAGLLAATSALGHQAWELRSRQVAQSQEIQALKLRAAPTLAARDKALALQAEGRALNEAMSGVMPLEVLQHVAQRLPAGVKAREIELVGTMLRVSLDVPATTPQSALIRELQAGNWLQDVRLSQAGSGQGITLEMRVANDRPPPVAPAAEQRSGQAAPPAAPAAGIVSPAPTPLPAVRQP
jgi:hypothetical protein